MPWPPTGACSSTSSACAAGSSTWGGPANTVSINTALAEIERLTGAALDIRHGGWRQGDQCYFVADTRALGRETGWSPQVGWRDGLARLMDWLVDGNIVRRPAPMLTRAIA